MVVFNVLLKLISKIFALALLVILSIIDCLFSVLAICGVLVGNVLKYLTGFYFLLVIFGQGGDMSLSFQIGICIVNILIALFLIYGVVFCKTFIETIKESCLDYLL